MQANNLTLRDLHLQQHSKNKLKELTTRFETLFGPLNTNEINTTVEAEIKTTINDPVYSKIYPNPVQMRSEVDLQIAKLLEDGIIRPFKSPYNSPLWVVEKKMEPQTKEKIA